MGPGKEAVLWPLYDAVSHPAYLFIIDSCLALLSPPTQGIGSLKDSLEASGEKLWYLIGGKVFNTVVSIT